MKVALKKLEFLLIYVVVCVTAWGVMRKVLVSVFDWMAEVPAVVKGPENFY
jgi:hypothetical protein